MNTPLISIILPTYNGAQFIGAAIKSVLSQTYTQWELLVISDGSTDNTEDVVAQFTSKDSRISYMFNEQNLGIQKTLNKGISIARGKYIARLDDDDRWIDASKLAMQVTHLEAYPECVLVGTDAIVMNGAGVALSKNIMPKSDKTIRAKMLSKNCFLHATVVFRKSAIDNVGGYSESSSTLHAEDYDLWLRLGTQGMVENLPLYSTALIARESSLTSLNRVLQAKNIVSLISQYKTQYPNFIFGYCVSLLRYAFFVITSVIPFPRKLMYSMQRIYRAI
ncbi:MAG: glycosyltransferase [Patescibacteria group bacterium]